MLTTDDPIHVPLGSKRELMICPTSDPDCVHVFLQGRFAGSLLVVQPPRVKIQLFHKGLDGGRRKIDLARKSRK